MTEDKTAPRFYSAEDMAAILGVKVDTIYTLVKRGELPVIRIGRGKGGGIRVRRDAFEDWLKRKEQEGQSHGE